MNQIIEIVVPDIGDFKNVPIIEIFAAAGATVGVDEALVVLESDKATIDVPSPAAGTIKEVKVKLGDKVSQGSALILLEPTGATVAAPAAPPAPPAPAAAPPASPAPPAPAPAMPAPQPAVATLAAPPPPAMGALPHASPSIRRAARELGVDLGLVRGSGPKGRVLLGDLQDFVKQAIAGKAATRAASYGYGPRLRPAALAADRLCQIRPGRAGTALEDQENLRRQPVAQFHHDPARREHR